MARSSFIMPASSDTGRHTYREHLAQITAIVSRPLAALDQVEEPERTSSEATENGRGLGSVAGPKRETFEPVTLESPAFTVSDPTTIGAGETLELSSGYSGQISFAAPIGGASKGQQPIDDRGLAPLRHLWRALTSIRVQSRGRPTPARDTYGLGGRPALRNFLPPKRRRPLELVSPGPGKLILAASTFRR